MSADDSTVAGVLEAIRDAVVVVGPDRRVSDVNAAMCALTGFDRATLIGASPPYPWDPDDASLDDGVPDGATEIRARDGRGVAVLVTSAPLGEDGGGSAGRVLTFRDRAEEILARSDLRDSLERYRSIVETAVDAVVTIDEDGTVIAVNPAATRLFGHPPDAMIGRDLAMLMPEPYASEHSAHLMRYLRDGSPRIIGTGRRVPGLRADGTVFPMHLSVGEMEVGGRRAFTGILRDETAAVAAERQLRRARDEHEALRRLAMTVAVEAPPEIVFAEAAEMVARLLDVKLGLVARFEGAEAHVVGAWTSSDRSLPRQRDLRGEGALAKVHRTGAPAVVPDYRPLAAAGDPAGT